MGEIVNDNKTEVRNVYITESNMKSHYHFTVSNQQCTNYFGSSYPYLSYYCTTAGIVPFNNAEYYLGAVSSEPNQGRTSSVGGDEPLSIDIMQPTVFVGNLFIYSGDINA